ncbi:MAG: hypothetical protein HFJ65_05880 [Eggerthellaceae bacterium]|nr:hypothetical protein [Eggerthellaceae bacterium]
MEGFVNVVRSNMMVQGVVCIALGAFLMFWPDATIITVIYLMGLIFALTGAASLVGYFRQKSSHYRAPAVLTTGVFFLVLALIVFIFPAVIASFASVALGVVLALAGVVSAVRSFELRSLHGPVWIIMLAVSALVAIGGIVIIANPFETTSLFVFMIGAVLLVNGIADVVIEVQSRNLANSPNS